MAESLSHSARRRALQLRLERIHDKIVSVENELAALSVGGNPGLFESPGLESLRRRLYDLNRLASSIEAELGVRRD